MTLSLGQAWRVGQARGVYGGSGRCGRLGMSYLMPSAVSSSTLAKAGARAALRFGAMSKSAVRRRRPCEKSATGDDTFRCFDGIVNGAPPQAIFHLYFRVYHLRCPDNARLGPSACFFSLPLHFSGARPLASSDELDVNFSPMGGGAYQREVYEAQQLGLVPPSPPLYFSLFLSLSRSSLSRSLLVCRHHSILGSK